MTRQAASHLAFRGRALLPQFPESPPESPLGEVVEDGRLGRGEAPKALHSKGAFWHLSMFGGLQGRSFGNTWSSIQKGILPYGLQQLVIELAKDAWFVACLRAKTHSVIMKVTYCRLL